jgi:hypothetical protein
MLIVVIDLIVPDVLIVQIIRIDGGGGINSDFEGRNGRRG